MIFEKVKQFVDQARPDLPVHYPNTVEWLLKLYPKADEVMQAAAYAHDIERAFRNEDEKNIFVYKKIRTDDPEYLRQHQVAGARIIREFLERENLPQKEIGRIENMILHHEDGGDPESDLIKDADSLSFFEVNALGFMDKFLEVLGYEKTKGKFDFMLNRISGKKAKKLAQPLYHQAVKYLNSKIKL